ncbi:signal peptidase I [Myxosarcina sp. GI1(2024)]
MTLKEKNLNVKQNNSTSKIDNPQREVKKTNWRGQFRENATTVGIALVLAFLIRVFIAEPRYIPSDSMLPTLIRGDRLVVEKVAYKFSTPAKGDIVVFQPPMKLRVLGYQKNQAFIKRAIATAGDTIAVKEGIVIVNNHPLTEKYIAEPPAYNLPLVTVPEGEVFVMGDNRNNSNDSHVWGFLPTKNIIGHAIFRFWPLERIGVIK